MSEDRKVLTKAEWGQLPERLRSKISRRNNGCWEWTGHLRGKGGYGGVRFNGRNMYAHVVVFELTRGLVPPGLCLDHLCRNRRCVNPDHLEPVTLKTNILRGVSPSAQNAQKTHCPNGHKYTDDSVYNNKRSVRQCKLCGRVQSRNYYLSNREEVLMRQRAKRSLEREEHLG